MRFEMSEYMREKYMEWLEVTRPELIQEVSHSSGTIADIIDTAFKAGQSYGISTAYDLQRKNMRHIRSAAKREITSNLTGDSGTYEF